MKSLLVLLLGTAVGCSSASVPAAADGGHETASTCPNDLPNSCPSTAPSYRSDIVPILKADCIHCHSPTGVGGYSETTYADVYEQRSAILDQVYSCLMPPASYSMAIQQRETLLAWLVCGAPDN